MRRGGDTEVRVVIPPPLFLSVVLVVSSLLLFFLSCTNAAGDAEVNGWFRDGVGSDESDGVGGGGDGGQKDGTATPPPSRPTGPDCRVCAADPAPLSQCPSGRTPCGIEGVYSLRANWRCGGGGKGAAEEHALSTIAASSIGPHPGDTPPARQVEVALDARAETGYGVVLDRTRQFLARLICHRGDERDCARFPAAAPCPPRIVRDNGLCVFADATGRCHPLITRIVRSFDHSSIRSLACSTSISARRLTEV